MKVRFIRDEPGYAAGTEWSDFDPSIIELYLARGVIEIVPDEPATKGKAMSSPPRNKMVREATATK